jgi:hypothetical protein
VNISQWYWRDIFADDMICLQYIIYVQETTLFCLNLRAQCHVSHVACNFRPKDTEMKGEWTTNDLINDGGTGLRIEHGGWSNRMISWLISYPFLSIFIISNLLPWTETRRSSCPVFCWVAFPPVVDSWNIAISNKNKKVHYGPFLYYIHSCSSSYVISHERNQFPGGKSHILLGELGWILRNRSHIESWWISMLIHKIASS